MVDFYMLIACIDRHQRDYNITYYIHRLQLNEVGDKLLKHSNNNYVVE